MTPGTTCEHFYGSKSQSAGTRTNYNGPIAPRGRIAELLPNALRIMFASFPLGLLPNFTGKTSAGQLLYFWIVGRGTLLDNLQYLEMKTRLVTSYVVIKIVAMFYSPVVSLKLHASFFTRQVEVFMLKGTIFHAITICI